MLRVVAEQGGADVVLFEVEDHAHDPTWKLDHLARKRILEAVDARDAVADRQDGAGSVTETRAS